MNRNHHFLLTFLLLTPLTTFASGGDVIMTLMIDVLTVLGLLLFIVFLKWKMMGKILLLFILFISEFFSWIMLDNIPYQKNANMINVLSLLIPLFSVMIVFFLVRKKYIK